LSKRGGKGRSRPKEEFSALPSDEEAPSFSREDRPWGARGDLLMQEGELTIQKGQGTPQEKEDQLKTSFCSRKTKRGGGRGNTEGV